MTLCDIANQLIGYTQLVVNPLNISCDLVLTQVDVFFLIIQERDDDLIISKLVAHLYST
jgi:hypothetical protein